MQKTEPENLPAAISETPDLLDGDEPIGVWPEQLADHLELLGWTLVRELGGKKP